MKLQAMNNYMYESGFVHPRFRLNGIFLDKESLLRVAYDFIKEGADFERATGAFLLDWFDDKPYVQMKTSGTTGTPKTMKLLKRHMVNSALATADFFEAGTNARALHCLSSQFVAGKMMLVRAIIVGWDIYLAAPSSVLLEKDERQYDFAALVPLQAEYSFERLSQIKKIILGGGKVSPALAARLQQLPIDIWETYAMTETVTHIAAKRVGDPAFTTLPDVSIGTDARGCLAIDAPKVTDGIVVTNDLVDIINDTHFVWLGRFDNVINSGGIKLYPEQIEEKLSHNIQPRYFVYGLPDDTLGERLVLVIEGESFTLGEVVFEGLDKYEKPKEVLFVTEFIETGSGKIQRAETLKTIG